MILSAVGSQAHGGSLWTTYVRIDNNSQHVSDDESLYRAQDAFGALPASRTYMPICTERVPGEISNYCVPF